MPLLAIQLSGQLSFTTHHRYNHPRKRLRSWSRHCATNRKVAGSIPDGIIGIFHSYNSSGDTMALLLTQPVLRAEHTLSVNLEASTSWNHTGPLSMSTVCFTFIPNKESRRLYSSIGTRGEQSRGDKSPWRSNFVRRRLMFVGPQYRTIFMSPFWRL